jgi:hypothetical protein
MAWLYLSSPWGETSFQQLAFRISGVLDGHCELTAEAPRGILTQTTSIRRLRIRIRQALAHA